VVEASTEILLDVSPRGASGELRPRKLSNSTESPGHGEAEEAEQRRPTAHIGRPNNVDYFARKHDISLEQARELMRKIGRDRDKLNEAAAKLFRR
jgi:hypothetical protein